MRNLDCFITAAQQRGDTWAEIHWLAQKHSEAAYQTEHERLVRERGLRREGRHPVNDPARVTLDEGGRDER